MPISGGGSSSLSEEVVAALVEALSGGGVGGGLGIPAYRFAKVAEVDIPAGKQTLILGETLEKSLREVTVVNLSEIPIELIWRSQESYQHFAILHPNGTLQDNNDGGIRLEAMATQPAKIRVAIRSETEIFYDIGTEVMPYFPIGVSLHIGTGTNFDYVSETFQDTSSSVFDTNIAKFFDSDEGITGYKLAALHSFTPGEEIEFNVVVNGSSYTSDTLIQFQWLNYFSLARLLLAVGADVINPENSEIDSSVAGAISGKGWAGEFPVEGGILKVKPNFLNFVGRFAAVSYDTDMHDTAIITSYTANETDPLKGGTFTLEGF